MSKSQTLPNRAEYRSLMRKFKHSRGLNRKKTEGAFGKTNRFIGNYKSLQVIPLHKRNENHNTFGVVKSSK